MTIAFQEFFNHAKRFRETTTKYIHRETLVDAIEILAKEATEETKNAVINMVEKREGLNFDN